MALLGVMVACAPHKTEMAVSDGEEAAVADTAFTGYTEESDCSICHVSEQDSYGDESCLAVRHASVACATCHDDAEALSDRHDGATAEMASRVKRLRFTEVEAETCLECHGSWNEIAEATSAVVVTDSNGTEINPHGFPENDTHAQIACVDCHSVHVSEEEMTTVAKDECKSCHHQDVFECGTCHE